MAWQETKAMANYVLSYAFSDQVFLTYARAALTGLREAAGEAARRIATRHAAGRREHAIRRDLRTLDRRSLRDIGLV
jgi:hypothetical protein